MKTVWKIFVWFHLFFFLVVLVCPRIILVAGDTFSVRRVPVICGLVFFHPLLLWQIETGEAVYLGHRCHSWRPKDVFRIEFPIKPFLRFFSRTPFRE
jgi:hypothetical protein